ncbi:MAG: hypothetical protein VX413_01825 [Verrucomicrobiota bacterium]|jgi:hypothetical protein|nr:hypothetical protein [Verrucomicrobiota bacterium]
MIGLLVILPVAFFAGWILKKSIMLYRGRAWPIGWVSLFWASIALGFGLGIWFCGFAEWEAMQFRRLPIPIARLDPTTGIWSDLEMPKVLLCLSLMVDFLAGLALAVFPITASMRLAEFMDESRRLRASAVSQSSPREEDTP